MVTTVKLPKSANCCRDLFLSLSLFSGPCLNLGSDCFALCGVVSRIILVGEDVTQETSLQQLPMNVRHETHLY